MGKLFGSLLVFIIFVSFDVATSDSLCGDWTAYKEEKCIKMMDKAGLKTYDEAEKICAENGAHLLSIHSAEEQTFMTDLIFTKSKVVDNVWIGAKFGDKAIEWQDHSEMKFTNWAVGSPKNHAGYCVQMHSDAESLGKWVDENCLKKYAVVCQKMANVAWPRLYEIVLEHSKTIAEMKKVELDLKKADTDKSKEIQELKKEITVNRHKLEVELLPIGFIYTQLPSQKSPSEIWPWMTWTDVTATYAGVFFRAEGGGAAGFGSVQEGDAPRVDVFDVIWDSDFNGANCKSYLCRNNNNPKGDWSRYVWIGDNGSGIARYIRMHTSNPEVRPRNMAVRIWKRTA